MFGMAKSHNCNVWETQNSEFQYSDKPKFTIPMFGKAKIDNPNICNYKI